jgi:hypothetical protein
MPALSSAEGFARESLPLHPAPVPRLASRSLSFALSPQLAPFPFNHFRTLSFFGSQLSRVLPAGCALFGKKPGVHPPVLPLSPPFPGTPFSRMATLSACLAFTGRWPLPVTPFTTSPSPRENLRGVATLSPLTPFTATLTQKQGGTGYWPALSAVEGSYQSPSPSAVDCRLLASPPFPPPCPSSVFPLKWAHPFPVITEENQ